MLIDHDFVLDNVIYFNSNISLELAILISEQLTSCRFPEDNK